MTGDLHPLADALRAITRQLPVGFAGVPIVDNWTLRQHTRPRRLLCALRRSIEAAGQLHRQLKRA